MVLAHLGKGEGGGPQAMQLDLLQLDTALAAAVEDVAQPLALQPEARELRV